MTTSKSSPDLPGKICPNEVMLALALEKDQPRGSKPMLVEIAAWRAGAIAGKRAIEIKSHVARDPDCYRMFADLIDAERELNAEVVAEKSPALGEGLKEWFSGWRWGLIGGGMTVALASVFIGIIGLRMLMETDVLVSIDQDLAQWSADTPPAASGWGRGLMSKGFDLWDTPTPLETAKTAISAGIRAGLEQLTQQGAIAKTEPWQHAIASYAAKSKPCAEGEAKIHCLERNELLIKLGRWTVLMAFDCQSSTAQPTNDYWILQKKRLDEFSQGLSTSPGLEALQARIQQWPIPPASEEEAFCREVENFKAFVVKS